MNKKVMIDLLDRGHNGNSILQILDALCVGMGDSSSSETSDIVTEELVETSPKSKKSRKEPVEV